MSQDKPKLSQKELDAIIDVANDREDATGEAMYKTLCGKDSKTSEAAPPPQAPKMSSPLSAEEIEKLQKECVERNKKYFGLREEERHPAPGWTS